MLAFSNDYYGFIFRATQSVELFCAYNLTVFRSGNKRTEIKISLGWDLACSTISNVRVWKGFVRVFTSNKNFCMLFSIKKYIHLFLVVKNDLR